MRVQRAQLLDRMRGPCAEIRHGNPDELASVVIVLPGPEKETSEKDGGEKPRVSGAAEKGFLRQETRHGTGDVCQDYRGEDRPPGKRDVQAGGAATQQDRQRQRRERSG